MAAAATLSDKASDLDSVSKTRYIQKISLINGVDPYSISKKDWSHDATKWPNITYPDIVSYLVFSKSAYSLEQIIIIII